MKLPEAITRQIAELITTKVGRCSIYVFGYRNEHFYILILSDSSLTGTRLMNDLSLQTDKAIKATVLLHSPKRLATKQASQEYFFDWVLKHGQRLQLDKQNVPYVMNHSPKRDLNRDALFWYKCVAVAQFNIQAAKDSPQEEVTLCKIALLNTACVQLALGLIRVFLGYIPKEFGLNYLLQLCGHFTDLPQEVFPKATDNDIRLYKMLCAPAGMLLHWTRLNAAEVDFEILLERCELFLKKAGELAQERLNELES